MTALHFDARIATEKLQKDIDLINKRINGMSQNVQREGAEIDAIGKRIGNTFATAFAAFSAGKIVKDISSVRGEFQQLEIAFETMLGNKAQADKLMAEVVEFAAITPFELKEVATGSKQLLAYGIAAENILPTLKSLGDISAGLSVPIERLILNYGQVRTQLKLTSRELRDFQVAGVPIVAELAKNLDVAEKKIAEMVSAGEIGFDKVEEAFRTMTGEGGRFNDLMIKQSASITGLASNFADALDEMMNSIGEANQGIISGSIKGAIELIKNYEEVIKIIKILVVTYGSYKAAVITTAMAEKAMATASFARRWIELAKGIQTATQAQRAFNLVSKANPYGLIASALGAVVSMLLIFRNETKDTQDYIDELNESISGIGKQTETDKLIDRYKKLTGETNRTADEQKELEKTIVALGNKFPQLITRVDSYGNALELATDKLIAMNSELRDNENVLLTRNIAETEDEVNKLVRERTRLQESLTTGVLKYWNAEKGSYETVKISNEARQSTREQISKLTSDIDKLNDKISEGKGQLRIIDEIGATEALAEYKNLFGDVTKYTEQEALKIKGQLAELLTLGLGSQAEAKIKEEIDKISNQLAQPTIKEQVDKAIKDLEAAKMQLEQMRKPGARTSEDDLRSKENEIKSLEEFIELYTGTKIKADEKIAQQQRKAAQEALKIREEFAQSELNLERQLQASRIAVKKQGLEREIAEAELAHKLELDRIQQQQEQYIEAWNATKGFERGDEGFVPELPESELERFNQLRINSEEKKNQQIVEINKRTANEIKALWSEVNDVYASDSDRAINEINARYEELLERAKQLGQTDMNDIYVAWGNALKQNTIQSGIDRLAFEEEIELQRAEISTQGYNREYEIERKKLEIVKDFAQKKINVLKRSNEEGDKQDIARLELLIKASDQGLEQLNREKLAERISGINQMVGGFKELSDAILGADSQLSELFQGFEDVGNILAQIAAGNYLGAATGVLATIAGWYRETVTTSEELEQAERRTREEAARLNDLLRERIKIMESLGLLTPFESVTRDVEVLNQKLNDSKDVLDDYFHKFLLGGKQTTVSIKQMLDTVYGSDWGATELGNSMKDWDDFFNTYLKIVGGTAYNYHPLSNFSWVMDKNKFAEDLNVILEYASEIESVYANLYEKITGTTTDGIAQSIMDGFKSGYNSISEFSDTFEDMLKNAIYKAIQEEILHSVVLDKFYKKLYQYAEDGYTKDEIEDLRNNSEYGWNALMEMSKNITDNLTKISGLDFGITGDKQKGLTGHIQNITEETGTLIAGQFFAFRELQQKIYDLMLKQSPDNIVSLGFLSELRDLTQNYYFNAVEQLDALNQSVTHLERISENTKHNLRLVSIDERIGELNDYLKKAI